MSQAVIKAIGVGGGGGNMINHLKNECIDDIELIVANTDAQALGASSANYKIQLGIEKTKGLGAGMKPDVGEEAAIESRESVKTMLEGGDLIFISAGLGGGTGTGAAPIIASVAKELGALTVSIATTPFKFEGRKRRKLAEAGLKRLREESDSIILISNENLLKLGNNLGMRDSFLMVDRILSEAITGISSLIRSHNTNDINLDFADVKTVMSHKGLALMGIGNGKGDTSASHAAIEAMSSPLLNDIDIKGAMGVIVHFKIHPDYPLQKVSEAMDLIEENSDIDADIIFGTSASEELEIDEVKLTLIATGFEKGEEVKSDENISDKTEKKDVFEKKLFREPKGIIREQRTIQKEIPKSNGNWINLDEPSYLRNR